MAMKSFDDGVQIPMKKWNGKGVMTELGILFSDPYSDVSNCDI